MDNHSIVRDTNNENNPALKNFNQDKTTTSKKLNKKTTSLRKMNNMTEPNRV